MKIRDVVRHRLEQTPMSPVLGMTRAAAGDDEEEAAI